MPRFANAGMQRMYDACRAGGADKASEFWLDGEPRRTGAMHRIAYWAGRDGKPCGWDRGTLSYACWAAGRDERGAKAAEDLKAGKTPEARPRFEVEVENRADQGRSVALSAAVNLLSGTVDLATMGEDGAAGFRVWLVRVTPDEAEAHARNILAAVEAARGLVDTSDR